MNKEKRKAIKENNKKIEFVIDILNKYKEEIELIQSDEEEAYNNLPEGFQDGLRGQDMQDAIDEIEEMIDEIDDIIERLSEVKNNLSVL